jgi:ABC-type dipeptide/oligopeptide/nickel transport system ATPase component
VFRAVDGLDLTLDSGSIVGIVGESGPVKRRHAGGLDTAARTRPC